MTDFYIEDGELRVRLPRGAMSRLFVQGALQAEFGLDTRGPKDLDVELGQARASRAACDMMRCVLQELREQATKPDHMIKATKRTEAFAAGLEAGLQASYRVIGRDPDHNIQGSTVSPEHPLNGPSFNRGWGLGSAIYAAVEIAQGKPDPRKAWHKPRRRKRTTDGL